MEDAPKRITVGLIVSWLLGILFGISGLVLLFENPLAGLLLLLIAIVLLPPANRLMAKKMKFSLSRGLKLIVVVILLIVMGIVMSGDDGMKSAENQNGSVNSTATPIAAEKVDVATFVGEFDKNQLAAEEKWEGRTIQFTGRVSNISEDILGNPYVIVEPRNAGEYYFGTSIQCFFKSKSPLTALENGGVSTFQGRVDSQLMNVLVKDCQIITP